MQIIENSEGRKLILIDCPVCDGDGYIIKCNMPGEHDGSQGENQEGYKDSFQKEEENNNHKHKAVRCEICEGMCLVLAPLDKLVVFGGVKSDDEDQNKPGS